MSASCVSKLPFIKGCRLERIGDVQEIVRFGQQQNSLHLIPNPHHKELHDTGMKGEGVNVYVLDTYNQAFASDGQYKDFLPDNFQGYDGWHGENVCRIVKEVAPLCELSVGRVGNDKNVEEAAAFAALEWAIFEGADVINMSWGFEGLQCSELIPCPICRLCNEAHKRNMCVIVAAGNVRRDFNIHEITSCPAKNKKVVTVGSVNPTGNGKADHSCVGVSGCGKPNILSSGAFSFRGLTQDGTFYASPCMAGFVADIIGAGVPRDFAKSIALSSTNSLGISPLEQGNGVIDGRIILDNVRRHQRENTSTGNIRQV